MSVITLLMVASAPMITRRTKIAESVAGGLKLWTQTGNDITNTNTGDIITSSSILSGNPYPSSAARGMIVFKDNGDSYPYATKYYTFYNNANERYGIGQDVGSYLGTGGVGSELSLFSLQSSGNIRFYTGNAGGAKPLGPAKMIINTNGDVNFSRNLSTDWTMYAGAFSTPGATYTKDLSATGSISAAGSISTSGNMSASSIYTSNWFRSTGDTGWYSQSYGGGWHMTDGSWIRAYGGKHLYMGGGQIRTDGGGLYMSPTYYWTNNQADGWIRTNGSIYTPGQMQAGSMHCNGTSTFASGALMYPYLPRNTDVTGQYMVFVDKASGHLTRSAFHPGYIGLTSSSDSDRRLKNIGEDFKGGLDQIRQLKPYNYTLKKDKKKEPRVGVIAQDLQKIFPNALIVGETKEKYLMVRTEDMFYAMVNAIKEIDNKIQETITSFTSIPEEVRLLKLENEQLRLRIKELGG